MKIEIEIEKKLSDQIEKDFYIETGEFLPGDLLLPECENFIYNAIEEKIKNDNLKYIKAFKESEEKEKRFYNFEKAFQDWKREENHYFAF